MELRVTSRVALPVLSHLHPRNLPAWPNGAFQTVGGCDTSFTPAINTFMALVEAGNKSSVKSNVIKLAFMSDFLKMGPLGPPRHTLLALSCRCATWMPSKVGFLHPQGGGVTARAPPIVALSFRSGWHSH